MSSRKRQIEALFVSGDRLQAGEVAHALSVTRQTAHRYLRQLVSDGRLIVEGAGRSTRYRRSAEGLTRRYPTAGLDEDSVWREMSSPGSVLESLPETAQGTLQYALTEMVNNAIDHSGASTVIVKLSKEGLRITLEVVDEGFGIFAHIRDRMDLRS